MRFAKDPSEYGTLQGTATYRLQLVPNYFASDETNLVLVCLSCFQATFPVFQVSFSTRNRKKIGSRVWVARLKGGGVKILLEKG